MKHCLAVIAFAACCCCAPGALAQKFQPFGPVDYEPDFQLFAPVDLGDFGEPPNPSEGYFFVYERLNWTIGGVNTTVGKQLPIFQSIVHYADGPAPTFVLNSIDGAVPPFRFNGWGNRLDMGYVVDNRGWLVGVLDTELNQGMTFGEQPGTNPDFDPADNPAEAPAGAIFGTNPLGSVAIIFTHPLGLMDGFIDVEIEANPPPLGVQRTNVGDGFADDIDRDQIHGPDGQDVGDGGAPDTFNVPVDFDDLVTFLPTFRTVTTRSMVDVNGVELMKIHRLRPFHHGSLLELYYGARYMRFRDVFNVDTTGGTLGVSNWDTRAINHIIGPQLGARLLKQRGRWKLSLESRLLAGYNIQNFRQTGNLGGNLVAGALNSPLYFNPTSFRHGRRDQDFTPIGELRAQATFQVTRSVALNVGWTGLFANNIARAAPAVNYTLPNMGLLEVDPEDIVTNSISFGVNINH